jgi:hypothetical protein
MCFYPSARMIVHEGCAHAVVHPCQHACKAGSYTHLVSPSTAIVPSPGCLQDRLYAMLCLQASVSCHAVLCWHVLTRTMLCCASIC